MIALRCVIFMNVRRTISFWKRGLPPRMKRLTNCSKTPPGGDPAECIRLGLIDDQGAIQGVCEQSFGYPNPDSSYLGLLILSPELRGSGYGPILFERMKNTAVENNCSELFVAVLAPNTRGRAFWERMGFTFELSSDPITTGVATHVRHRLRLDLNSDQTP